MNKIYFEAMNFGRSEEFMKDLKRISKEIGLICKEFPCLGASQ
jgi:predicted transcriptional regulator